MNGACPPRPTFCAAEPALFTRCGKPPERRLPAFSHMDSAPEAEPFPQTRLPATAAQRSSSCACPTQKRIQTVSGAYPHDTTYSSGTLSGRRCGLPHLPYIRTVLMVHARIQERRGLHVPYVEIMQYLKHRYCLQCNTQYPETMLIPDILRFCPLHEGNVI